MKNHILVMTKFPRTGEVNTRMAPEIGAEKAAEVHRNMAEHIIGIAGDIDSVRSIVHIANSTEQEANQWLGSQLWMAQQGANLGERMAHAINFSFSEGAKKVLVVGTDCPTLNVDIFEQAFQAIENHDVVYAPAHDGGYVLVGMKELQPEAFQNIDWGTENVLQQSLQHLTEAGKTFALLEPMLDIDFAKDIPSEFL